MCGGELQIQSQHFISTNTPITRTLATYIISSGHKVSSITTTIWKPLTHRATTNKRLQAGKPLNKPYQKTQAQPICYISSPQIPVRSTPSVYTPKSWYTHLPSRHNTTNAHLKVKIRDHSHPATIAQWGVSQMDARY